MTKQGHEIIKEKIKTFSHKAGVYRMLDEDGKVLYVGKAKDLIHRLTNYTRPEKLSFRIREMVAHVKDVVVIETAGETEAFLLENELIKQYRPYYNILLKDDKSYPYIALSKDTFPRLFKYRGKRQKGVDYFGPFDSGESVNHTLIELQKLFGLRSCKDSYFNNRTRPCLMYQIKRCSAPCCQKISPFDYQKSVAQARDFLTQKSYTIQENLQAQMMQLSANQEYEKAAVLRDKIAALNRIQGTSQALPNHDTDTIAYAYANNTLSLQVFFHRTDRLTGHQEYILNHVDENELDETLASLILQLYTQVPPPDVICLSWKTDDVLSNAVSEIAQKRIRINHPPFKQIKKDWMVQALQSAERALNTQENKQKTWMAFADLLGVSDLKIVDIFDNSHLQGTNAVGAVVSAGPDGFLKNRYRRYNVPQELAGDDFGMMRYVLKRRLIRGKNDGCLPDALLLDGGKGQLSSVMQVLNELQIQMKVLAMAKGAGQHDKGLEIFYLNSDPNTPIHLDLKGDLMHLLQRLRDEAHRFVIGSHRAKREKGNFHERLQDIEDIGPKRRKMLMLHFGSVRAISGASVEQIKNIPGFNEKIAKKVYTFFHNSAIT